VGVSRDCPIFGGTPYYLRNGKATNFKFCVPIYRLNRNKSPLNILGKVAIGIVRDSRKFSGLPSHTQGALRGHLFDNSAFSFLVFITVTIRFQSRRATSTEEIKTDSHTSRTTQFTISAQRARIVDVDNAVAVDRSINHSRVVA